MKCSGIDAISGAPVEVSFAGEILAVRPAPAAAASLPWLAPGFIDLQVNGFAGVDFNNPRASQAEIARSIRALWSTGVTRFFPTVITGSPEDMQGALRNLAGVRERLPEGSSIEGFHVEGPHISPDDGPRGAHPRRWVRPPSVDEFRRLQDAARGGIRLLTLSPEWPEAPGYIEAASSAGVTVSIGHTNASAAQIQAAVSAGARMSTHLGNGAHAILPRHPNYIWEQLAEDRLAAGFIVDGIHLPLSFLRVALRAKGPERSILVTDAAMPAACAPGRYRLGEQDVDLTPDNRVVLAGQSRLAGSSLQMHHGVANLMRLAGLPLAQAVRMATLNPARTAGIDGRQHGLHPRDRGDLVEFLVGPDHEVRIVRVYLNGQTVFAK